jgi:hypothetical protein
VSSIARCYYYSLSAQKSYLTWHSGDNAPIEQLSRSEYGALRGLPRSSMMPGTALPDRLT